MNNIKVNTKHDSELILIESRVTQKSEQLS